jgi:predicted esterase
VAPGAHGLQVIATDDRGGVGLYAESFYIVPSNGELTGQHPYTAGLGKIKEYLRFIPDDYNSNTNKQWPLILWLHGSGNRGSDATKLRGAGGPPSRIKNNDPLLDDFIVLSPQCVSGAWWSGNTEQNQMDALLQDHLDRFRIDTNRLIITGQSMGGQGTWKAITRNPERYAAAVPICGKGEPGKADTIADMPIWIFHGDQDNTVPYLHSVDMYNALTNAGAQNTEFHTITNGPHNVWTETYQRSDLYEWMLLMSWMPQFYPGGGALKPLLDQDTDGDGMTAEEEFNAGTLPTSAASVFKCLPLQQSGKDWKLRWMSISGKQYTVYGSTNLLSGWAEVQTGIPADPSGMNMFIRSDMSPAAFYCVETVR